MTEWFETWFNTDEYLNVYRHRNESEAAKHISFIIQNTKFEPPASVLDLACGAGRHSIIFSKKGFDVTAVDLSERLLCEAKKLADEEGIDIEFIKSDLRDLNLDREFTLVINLFTSFGYFKDDEENFKIFDIAFKHLRDNGRFVIDFLNKNYIEKNLREYSEDSFLNKKIIQRRAITGDRVIKNIEILSDGKTSKFYESVRMFSYEELIYALNDRGLFVDRIYGDFGGSKFDPEKSERIIIFAVK